MSRSSPMPIPGDRLVDVIVTVDHVAALWPAVELLEPILQYRRLTFAPGGPQGHRGVEEDVILSQLDVEGRLCFSAGLLPRVCGVLGEHGYRVRIDDRRKPGPRL